MEFHFSGDWVVVARTTGDDNPQGVPIGFFKRRYLAEQDAAEWRKVRPEWQVWTARRADYY